MNDCSEVSNSKSLIKLDYLPVKQSPHVCGQLEAVQSCKDGIKHNPLINMQFSLSLHSLVFTGTDNDNYD